MPKQRQLNPKIEDVQKLVEQMPAAGERLQIIILERLLQEAEARLSQQNGHQEPIPDAADQVK